jgi:hypothetical protein
MWRPSGFRCLGCRAIRARKKTPSNTLMRFRKLRIAWSVGWGLLAVLLIALWVRSYWWYDRIAIYSSTQAFGVASFHGELVYGSNSITNSSTKSLPWWYWSCEYITPVTRAPSDSYPKTMGFAWHSGEWSHYTFIPHWFPLAMATLFAVVTWIPLRFSLRTLLIATTLVAVVLELIVAVLCWPAR